MSKISRKEKGRISGSVGEMSSEAFSSDRGTKNRQRTLRFHWKRVKRAKEEASNRREIAAIILRRPSKRSTKNNKKPKIIFKNTARRTTDGSFPTLGGLASPAGQNIA